MGLSHFVSDHANRDGFGESRRLDYLLSAQFLIGLAALLLNDLYLKAAYPGTITGKLSDVAGLWIFPMFWSAIWPRRARMLYAATAMAFVVWKAPISQPAIDAWNAVSLMPIARVVDFSDLFALLVLPASYAAFRGRRREAIARFGRAQRLRMLVVMLGALFAFAATSSYGALNCHCVYEKFDPVLEGTVYKFPETPSELRQRLNSLRIDAAGEQFTERTPVPFSNYYEFGLQPETCLDPIELVVSFDDYGDGTTNFVLRSARVPDTCVGAIPKPEVRKLFERNVIDRLRAAP